MSQLSSQLALLRHPDATRVEEIFTAAHREAILAGIVETPATPAPPSRRRLPRARIALPVTAALVGCAIAVTLVLRSAPSVHAAGVSFRYPASGPDSGYIVATVTDPFAAQSSLDAAFRAAGLDITVQLVAASPSAVGTVVEMSSSTTGGAQIETLTGGRCVTGGGGPGNCPIGLKIPRDFSGSASIALGRPAKPGEDYESSNSAFAPGESLHCSGLIGMTVSAATPKLAARGITVRWSTSTPPGGYHILDATPIRAGVVMLETQAAPLTPARRAQASHLYDAGC